MKLYIVFFALDCLLKELSFPSKMNRIGNVQLWVLSNKLTFILLRIRITG